MDVQTLEVSVRFPGRRKTLPDAASARANAPDSGDGSAAAIAARWPALLGFTAIAIIAGLTALAWTTLHVPISAGINPNLDGSALAGPAGGLLLWTGYGMIGSMRVLPAPGGHSVWTFHLPFIAAAMVLGGPTAGGWVAFVSTLERRELEQAPWFGVLANHAVLAFGAVVGGLTVELSRVALAGSSLTPGVGGLIAVTLGTVVLATIANAAAAVTVMLREGLAPSSLVEVTLAFGGRLLIGEVVLAWVFSIAYAAVGWWSPLALALTALVLWPVDTEGPDALTSLPRLQRFRQFLDGAIGRTRLGLARGGLLVAIDLDRFGPINKDPQMGYAVGDEVLAEIGRRLRGQARTGDAVARPGGDEFGGYFAGTFDRASATRLGERLLREIKRPVVTSAGIVEVGASIGIVIVGPQAGLPDNASLMKLADATMQAVKREGGGVRIYDPYSASASGPADLRLD